MAMESPLDVLTRAATMIEANQLNHINGKCSVAYRSGSIIILRNRCLAKCLENLRLAASKFLCYLKCICCLPGVLHECAEGWNLLGLALGSATVGKTNVQVESTLPSRVVPKQLLQTASLRKTELASNTIICFTARRWCGGGSRRVVKKRRSQPTAGNLA